MGHLGTRWVLKCVAFCVHRESEYEDEFNMFLRGGESVLSGKPPKISGLAPEQVLKNLCFFSFFVCLKVSECAL